MSTPPISERPPTRTRLMWWGLILGLTLIFAGTVVTIALLVLKPSFHSIAELKERDIRTMQAFILNRPDGGPDIGEPREKGIPIEPADQARLLAILEQAQPVQTERGVWFGQITVWLADGRRQPIYLYRVQVPGVHTEPILRYTIGTHQYEAGPVQAFVDVMAECEMQLIEQRAK